MEIMIYAYPISNSIYSKKWNRIDLEKKLIEIFWHVKLWDLEFEFLFCSWISTTVAVCPPHGPTRCFWGIRRTYSGRLSKLLSTTTTTWPNQHEGRRNAGLQMRGSRSLRVRFLKYSCCWNIKIVCHFVWHVVPTANMRLSMSNSKEIILG